MRCLSCNVILTEYEQKRKYKHVTEAKNPEDSYINLCNKCLNHGEFDLDSMENVPGYTNV